MQGRSVVAAEIRIVIQVLTVVILRHTEGIERIGAYREREGGRC